MARTTQSARKSTGGVATRVKRTMHLKGPTEVQTSTSMDVDTSVSSHIAPTIFMLPMSSSDVG